MGARPSGWGAALAALLLAGCSGSGSPGPVSANGAGGEVAVAGVDTTDFTPREKREFARYAGELPAPCPNVTLSVARCVNEKAACPTCLDAAQLIAKAVREGMAGEQIEGVYKNRFDAASAKTIPVAGSPSRGPESAPVTVVEFADFECPFCQKIAPELDEVWEKRKNTVRFVYKFMPLSMHPHGEIAARAAIAAGDQGKFWEMHHKLFEAAGRLEQTDLEEYAKALGLDLPRFRTDMQSAVTTARIQDDHALADTLGVKGTPTIYVDGHEYDPKIDLGDWLDQEVAAHKR